MNHKWQKVARGGTILLGAMVLYHSMENENHDWVFDIKKQHTHHESRNPLDFTTRAQGFTMVTSSSTDLI